MKLRRKVHSVAEDSAQFLRKIEISQPHSAQCAGSKVRKHIDITSLRIEIVPQHRPEERQGSDAALSTKAADPFAIDHNGQVSRRHSERQYHPGLRTANQTLRPPRTPLLCRRQVWKLRQNVRVAQKR